MSRTSLRAAVLGVVTLAVSVPSFADEVEEVRKLRDTTIALVNLLVDQGVLTREKADALIAQAQQAGAKPPVGAATTAMQNPPPTAAASGPVSPGVVRVPYVPEAVKQEIGAEVKKEVLEQAKSERWGEPGAYPDWIHRVTWQGDVRLREEGDRFPTDSAPNASVAELNFFGVNIANSTEANNRMRVRARLGLEAGVGETVTIGMRLATGGVGAGSNPGSENQTLGNFETRSSVGFDLAFIAYQPGSALSFIGGRIGNPFFRPTTLVWADDVSLEGLAASLRPKFGHDFTWVTTAGLFPILQNDPTPLTSSPTKWLYAYQTGFDWRFSDEAGLKFGVALYDYRNIEGIPNPSIVSTNYNGTAASFRQTGNTVFDINGLVNTQNGTQNYLYGLASRFHELNVSTSLELGFIGPIRVTLNGDYVRNLGFNEREIIARTGYAVNRNIVGWQSRLMIGNPNMALKNSWQAWAGYRYVQRDATVDAFTDQDFHLGGTDAKGFYLGARYSFEKNTAIGFRWFSGKQIDGVELAGADGFLSSLPLAIDVVQVDLTSSF